MPTEEGFGIPSKRETVQKVIGLLIDTMSERHQYSIKQIFLAYAVLSKCPNSRVKWDFWQLELHDASQEEIIRQTRIAILANEKNLPPSTFRVDKDTWAFYIVRPQKSGQDSRHVGLLVELLNPYDPHDCGLVMDVHDLPNLPENELTTCDGTIDPAKMFAL